MVNCKGPTRKPDVWGTRTQIGLRTLRPRHPPRIAQVHLRQPIACIPRVVVRSVAGRYVRITLTLATLLCRSVVLSEYSPR